MWFHSQLKWFGMGFHSHGMWFGKVHLLRVWPIIIARHHSYPIRASTTAINADRE